MVWQSEQIEQLKPVEDFQSSFENFHIYDQKTSKSSSSYLEP